MKRGKSGTAREDKEKGGEKTADAAKIAAPSAVDRVDAPPVDVPTLREQITRAVGWKAIRMIEATIAQAENGHYLAMKYLFEMIGIYPATTLTESAGEDSLTSLILRGLEIPDAPNQETKVTKDSPLLADEAPIHAVK